MWDLHVFARHRQDELLRRSARRRRIAEARATAGRTHGRSRSRSQAEVRARRTLGFALVHAGLWILVGPRGRRRAAQLAWHPELKTARASEPYRS
jgi:hypothetical protein